MQENFIYHKKVDHIQQVHVNGKLTPKSITRLSIIIPAYNDDDSIEAYGLPV